MTDLTISVPPLSRTDPMASPRSMRAQRAAAPAGARARSGPFTAAPAPTGEDVAKAARVLERAQNSARKLYVTTRCLQVITGTHSSSDDAEPADSLAAAYEALISARAGAAEWQARLDEAIQAGRPA